VANGACGIRSAVWYSPLRSLSDLSHKAFGLPTRNEPGKSIQPANAHIRMLVQRDPPPPGPDKIQQYIERERDSGFIATLAKRPDLTLEYTVVQSDISMKYKGSDGVETDTPGFQFMITIRDLHGKSLA
jgi:hypothetical protein